MSQPEHISNGPQRFGVFEVDLLACELRKDGAKIKLEGHAFQVLALLLSRPGRVVTREEIKSSLWGSETFVDFEHGINAAVTRLREALGDSAQSPHFIETLPRRGYRFIYPLDGMHPAAPPLKPAPAAWRRSGIVTLVTAVVLLIGLLALNFQTLRQRLFERAPQIRSVVVLPFNNYTGDPKQDSLCDGFTDALTTELAEVKSLRVISVQSAMSYKGVKRNLTEIARDLNVDAAVEGSLLRGSDRLLVNVQLVLAPSDTHLWAQKYERSLQDFPVLVATAARDILVQSRARISQSEQARLARERAINPEAYTAYRMAREIWWSKFTEEGFWKSIDYYRVAIAKDPAFADAHAGMACSYAFLHQLYPSRELDAQARAAAAKAIELDPYLSEPHALLGYMALGQDWTAAEQEFRHAIELNPNDTMAHVWYSWFLNNRSRHQEALVEIRLAESLDPLSAYVSANVILRLIYLDRFEEAVQQAHKALELNRDFWLTHYWLGGAYWQQKQYDQAIQSWEKELSLPGDRSCWPLARLVTAYLQVGRRDDAFAALARLERISKPRYLDPEHLALAQAAVGKKEEALHTLEYALQTGNYHAQMFQRQFARYFGDYPPYEQFLRRAGVPLSLQRDGK